MAFQPDTSQLSSIVREVSDQSDAEIYLYAGIMESPHDHQFIDTCPKRPARPNALLVLETYGGDADSAYRMVQCLRTRHSKGKVFLFVDGMCKSAGTFLALGADALIMSDHAELGPLDVQVAKPDEIGGYHSGLVTMKALDVLSTQSFLLFEEHFIELIARSGRRITTRTAADLASNVVVGLLNPIYAQIDPLRLGENQRALEVGFTYGEAIRTDNVKPETVNQLVSGYPSHSFVIDRSAAAQLFNEVFEPTDSQQQLADLLGPSMVRALRAGSDPLILHLTSEDFSEPTKHSMPLEEAEGDAEQPKGETGPTACKRDETTPITSGDAPTDVKDCREN